MLRSRSCSPAMAQNLKSVSPEHLLHETGVNFGFVDDLWLNRGKAMSTIDFLLRALRDKAAARRYVERSIARKGEPETVTINESGANLASAKLNFSGVTH
jgi:hypothetical protein